MRRTTIIIAIIVAILIGCAIVAHETLAFECVKNKYQVIPYSRLYDGIGLYGIYTGSQEDFDYHLGDRRWVSLGNCWDNDKTINLYRTPAEEYIAKQNQEYLDTGIRTELTAEEIAIELLESLGYNIVKNE